MRLKLELDGRWLDLHIGRGHYGSAINLRCEPPSPNSCDTLETALAEARLAVRALEHALTGQGPQDPSAADRISQASPQQGHIPPKRIKLARSLRT